MNLTNIYFLHEIGGKRNQEDYIWPPAGAATLQDKVFIVCDGVGGSENGEVASRIVAEWVGNAIGRLQQQVMSATRVNELLRQAKHELVQHAARNRMNSNMATTFTLLALSDKKAFVAWCGDSRVYQIRKGRIIYRTSDHSLVNSLVKSGEITEQEARRHPQKNIILRAIKADESPIEADSGVIEDVQNGDYFMLCTDGLLENIADDKLESILQEHASTGTDLTATFQQLCRGKTKDNYSMYLIRVQPSRKPALYNRKIMALGLCLLLLVSASAFMISKYFTRKQHLHDNLIVTQPVRADSLGTTPASQPADTVSTAPAGNMAVSQPAEPAATPVFAITPELDSAINKALSKKQVKGDVRTAKPARDSTAPVQQPVAKTNSVEPNAARDSVKRPKALMPPTSKDSTDN